ncbi:MAG: ribonuclease P protein component [Acidobacteriota bacterium]
MRAEETPAKPRESLLREDRLRRRAEYQRCYEKGRRIGGRLVTLFVVDRESDDSGPRLGVTVTRRVGNAVERHRIKRRVKEIYRRWAQRNRLPPADIVVHLKPEAREADYQTLEKDLIRLLSPLTKADPRAPQRGR